MHAGGVQMAHFGAATSASRRRAPSISSPKSTSTSSATFRAMIAERFPDHAVLGEEFERRRPATTSRSTAGCSIPIDGTTNYAHGLPIFCCSLALEVDGAARRRGGLRSEPPELFTAERGSGAWLNGAPMRVSAADTLIDSLLVTGFHYNVQRDPGELMGLFAKFITDARARCGGWARRRSTSATSPPAGSTGSGSRSSTRGTSPAARSS